MGRFFLGRFFLHFDFCRRQSHGSDDADEDQDRDREDVDRAQRPQRLAERLEGRKAILVGVLGLAFVAVAGFLWASYFGELGVAAQSNFGDFGEALWTGRSIDVLAVTILIFVGVIGSMRLTTAGIEAMEADSESWDETAGETGSGRTAGTSSDEDTQEEVA